MIIRNGNRDSIQNQAMGLPDVSEAVASFLQPMEFELVTKEQVDGYTQEKVCCVNTLATRQPFSPQALAIKPEGERAWRWETLHTLVSVIMRPDDIVKFHGIPYRVKEKLDYSEYGYLEYHIVQDYRTKT